MLRMVGISIIAAILAVAQARIWTLEDCSGIIIHNIKFEQEVLQEVDSPFHLAIDYNTNTLFYSYSGNGDEVFKSAYINLETKEHDTIDGIAGGFANAVDSKNNLVFMGGRDGLYNFDYDTKKAVHMKGTHKNIWQLFCKDDIYFTTYPEEEAYTYKNGEMSIVPELANTHSMLIALDSAKNIYFTNSSGLFMHESSKRSMVRLGAYNLNGLIADSEGELFFSTPEGLYRIMSEKTVEKLASIDNVYGVAIDSLDYIIYATATALIRLKPTNNYCDDNKR